MWPDGSTGNTYLSEKLCTMNKICQQPNLECFIICYLKAETTATFLCLRLALDDICINHSGLQVSALLGWGDEARDVDLL